MIFSWLFPLENILQIDSAELQCINIIKLNNTFYEINLSHFILT